MTQAIDITAGQRFGRLEVVRHTGSRGGKTLFECRCDCGSTHLATGVRLRAGKTRSCGCARYGRPLGGTATPPSP